MSSCILYQGNFDEVHQFLKTFNPLEKTIITGKKDTGKRTLDQNAQAHVWYQHIYDCDKQEDLQGWERYCKLYHGVPILRATDKDYRAFYDLAIKHTLTLEQKLQAMDYTPVTRLMNKGQFQKYFEALQNDFDRRGIRLEFLNREKN